MVTEAAADPDVVTEYDYGDEEAFTTTITRAGTPDQVTVYTFLDSGNGRGLLDTVTDSVEGVTDYDFNSSTGRLTSVTGPDGVETGYEYNSKGAVTSITRSGGELSSQEFNWYRYSASDPETVWLVKHQDAEGNWTYYQRDMQSTPWQVDAIKVAGPSETEPNWANIDPVKTFEYYAANSADGRAGMLKKEIVPGVGGAVAQVTEYKYGYGVAGKWRESPTATIYQFWNGTSYEARTSTAVYDDLGRLLLSTDADGREVRYRYDALGRQTHVIYAWEDADSDEQYDPGEETVFTQNSYTCCGLEWSRDENGNKTYYGYDGGNRLAKTWTAITGQGANTPLVSYTYDAFSNQQTVTTRSGASTSRVTSYDYDSANRVTMTCPQCLVHMLCHRFRESQAAAFSSLAAGAGAL